MGEEYECYVCNSNLYVSLIANETDDLTYCIPHGIDYLKGNKSKIRHCKLLYTHTIEEIKDILLKAEQRLKNRDYVEDYDEEQLKPRDRALPSFVKREVKPDISSESEEEEEEVELESVDSGPKIT